ncbi:centrosomal protein of 97 kDa-like [Littorina saxatilis]|uniref:centrosomal protein of 97 kDa-like n=1 Tax=Littorina saxatilis TaxID=31220 RepID=UPI0038B47B20
MADNLEEDDVIVDWSRQGLWRLDLQPCHVSLTTLVADHNCITKLDTLQLCPRLQQLSLAHNRLVDMSGLSHLHNLTVLNLSANSISVTEGLLQL